MKVNPFMLLQTKTHSFRHAFFHDLWKIFIPFVFLAFGLTHLAQFETADEHYWITERIPRYWSAWQKGEYKKTLINDKPGISLALVSGIALPFSPDTNYYEPPSKKKNTPPKQIGPDAAQQLFLAFRLPILLFNVALLFFLFFAVKKLFRDNFVATLSLGFIALSPILIGISQIVNPDALLWSLGFCAALSFLLFLENKSKRFAVLTALFLALSLLAKYTAMIFVPLFLAMAILHRASHPKNSSSQDSLFFSLANLAGIFGLASLLMALFLPAIFLKPSVFFDLTLSFSPALPFILIFITGFAVLFGFVFENADSNKKTLIRKQLLSFGKFIVFIPFACILFLAVTRFWHDPSVFNRVPFDAKNIGTVTASSNLAEILLLEYNPLVFSLSPIVLFLLLFTWGKYLFSRPTAESKASPFILALSLPFLILPFGYLLSETIATVRYLIILYPFAALIAAIGARDAAECIRKRLPKAKPAFTLAFFLVLAFVSAFDTKPFFLNYTNFLLPKDKLISDAWGYGGYEAAKFINNQPNGKTATVWTDYAGVCPFIQGICINNTAFDIEKYSVDYAVITRRGEISLLPKHAKWSKPGRFNITPIYAETADTIWSLSILERPDNTIRVVRMKK